jgi:hypothetical protein
MRSVQRCPATWSENDGAGVGLPGDPNQPLRDCVVPDGGTWAVAPPCFTHIVVAPRARRHPLEKFQGRSGHHHAQRIRMREQKRPAERLHI